MSKTYDKRGEREVLTGEIYDLCNLALDALHDGIDSTSNGLRFLITEIKSRNTVIHDMAVRKRQARS